MFVLMIMLGAPITYRMGRDVCFDLITQSIPDWAQHICKMVSDVGVAFMGAFMGWQGLQYSLAYGDKILAGIEIPQWMMYVSQPVCGFTLVIVCLESFLLGIQWFANRKKVPAGKEVAE